MVNVGKGRKLKSRTNRRDKLLELDLVCLAVVLDVGSFWRQEAGKLFQLVFRIHSTKHKNISTAQGAPLYRSKTHLGLVEPCGPVGAGHLDLDLADQVPSLALAPQTLPPDDDEVSSLQHTPAGLTRPGLVHAEAAAVEVDEHEAVEPEERLGERERDGRVQGQRTCRREREGRVRGELEREVQVAGRRRVGLCGRRALDNAKEGQSGSRTDSSPSPRRMIVSPGDMPRSTTTTTRFLSFLVRVPWQLLHLPALSMSVAARLHDGWERAPVLRAHFRALAVALGALDGHALHEWAHTADREQDALR